MLSKRLYSIIAILFLLGTETMLPQCAMCRAVLESEAGQSSAEGVNNGIVYLMSIPYILVGAIGLLIYFKFFRRPNASNQDQL